MAHVKHSIIVEEEMRLLSHHHHGLSEPGVAVHVFRHLGGQVGVLVSDCDHVADAGRAALEYELIGV